MVFIFGLLIRAPRETTTKKEKSTTEQTTNEADTETFDFSTKIYYSYVNYDKRLIINLASNICITFFAVVVITLNSANLGVLESPWRYEPLI